MSLIATAFCFKSVVVDLMALCNAFGDLKARVSWQVFEGSKAFCTGGRAQAPTKSTLLCGSLETLLHTRSCDHFVRDLWASQCAELVERITQKGQSGMTAQRSKLFVRQTFRSMFFEVQVFDLASTEVVLRCSRNCP